MFLLPRHAQHKEIAKKFLLYIVTVWVWALRSGPLRSRTAMCRASGTSSLSTVALRRAAWELASDFDGTRKLSAGSRTRHGLLKSPNLIDIALFSITTLSVGPAGSWRGNLFSSCGWRRFAGTCAACSFHRWPGRAHASSLRGQGLSFHNRSTWSTSNSSGPGRAPHRLCCETVPCPGGTGRSRSGCCPAAVEPSSVWASTGARLACLSRFDAGTGTASRGLEAASPC